MSNSLAELKDYLGRLSDLGAIEGLADWDQQINMPPGAAEVRALQFGTLSLQIHELVTSDHFARLIEATERMATSDDSTKGIIRHARRRYNLATKLPQRLVKELSEATSLGQSVWQEARSKSDFKLFAPQLEKIVALVREQAECFGYQHHPYDALFDLYEEGMTTADIERLFSEMGPVLQQLVASIDTKDVAIRQRPLRGDFSPDQQAAVARLVAELYGFDFNRGRLDISEAHPFCASFTPNDVRLATRVNPGNILEVIGGVMHEAGHGLYEQGIAPALVRTGIDDGASLGLHESQSRLWENMVGRSRDFWEHHFEDFGNVLPQWAKVSPEAVYRAINVVQPGPIRVDADELTYNLHIMVRFNLEKDLVAGKIRVKDLPDAWNASYKEHLGITPANDAEGVLQDVHWSGGGIGYFPTYSVGNVLAAQFFKSATADEKVSEGIKTGDYGTLLDWLQANIYQHGATYLPAELVKRATGSQLDPKPYLEYLRTKYAELYPG